MRPVHKLIVCAALSGFLLTAVNASFAASSDIALNAIAGLHPQMRTAIIYSDTADTKADIRQALLKASKEHKHVLLDFGGNWCGDCQVLNIYFHDPGNASLLAANYVLVDVNVGEFNKNLDVAKKYGIPLSKGVPALAVLDASGGVLYRQKDGEFEKMRQMDPSAVTAFLMKWKPRPTGSHPASGSGKIKAGETSGQ